VTLVDTQGRGVERMTKKGVVVDGVEYPLDCLIFATGFEVGTAYTRRSEFEVHGRGGQTLSQYWRKGMRTYHGFFSHGFPNCFHLGLTQTGLAPNFTYMLNEQSTHLAYVISSAKARGAKVVECTPEAEAEWVRTVSQPGFMSEYLKTCTPGYYNAEGKAGSGEGFLEGHYGEGPVQFYALLEKWRQRGQLEGLTLG
jgi:cyclohexanone monooxygenase